MRVIIDGIIYHAETELEAEARMIMASVYCALQGEGFYDPLNAATGEFARPLAVKMRRLNELLDFNR